MSNRPQQPAPVLRRLRAKLRTFNQPGFILPVAAFCLLSFFLWRALFPIGELDPFQTATDSSQNQLDPDEQAAGVDIDSLPVLLSDINSTENQVEVPAVNLLNLEVGKQGNNSKSSPNLLSQKPNTQGSSSQNGNQLQIPQLTSNYPVPNYNPISNSTTANTPSVQGGFNFSQNGLSSLPGLPGQTGSSGLRSNAATTVSPLQAAMNQYLTNQTQNNSPTGQTSGNPTGQFFPPNYNQSYFGPPTTYFPPTGTDNSASASTPGMNYQTLPTTDSPYIQSNPTDISTRRRPTQFTQPLSTGTTSPSIVPSAIPIDPGDINSLRQSTGSSGQSNYDQNSGSSYGSPSYGAPPQNTPTSVSPYSVPRSIGNGQINTFSNP